MCLAKAYLNRWDSEPVLRDIAQMKLGPGRVELETLLGVQKSLPGLVVEVDFAASKILVAESRDA